jgi:hypothetical protein
MYNEIFYKINIFWIFGYLRLLMDVIAKMFLIKLFSKKLKKQSIKEYFSN